MRKPFWLLALALIASVNSLQADGQSPVKTVWSRRLKLEGYDSSEFTLLDKNGNVFAFASLAQWPYLVRYGSDGHLNWDRRLIYYPRGNPIAVSQNGNCFSIQAARTSNTLSLVCLSPEGDLVWSQPASTGPTALAIDPNGDLLVAGSVTAK